MDFWMIFFICLLPVSAFLYASVGHGGASSYLMILTLMGFAPADIRPTVLILNIFVSLVSYMHFKRQEQMPQNLFWSLALFSIPAAYIGGTITLDTAFYRTILGVVLLLSSIKFLGFFPDSKQTVTRQFWMAPLLGIAIGLVSGMVGIGGGVLLSPVILVLGWANVKQTALLSSLFIFLNSIAGLLGAAMHNISSPADIWVLVPVTLIGGVLGGYFGAKQFSINTLKYLLSIVLLFAAVKLILN